MPEDPDEQVGKRGGSTDGNPSDGQPVSADSDARAPGQQNGPTEDRATDQGAIVGNGPENGGEFDESPLDRSGPVEDHPGRERAEDASPSIAGILGSESAGEDAPRPSLEPETPELENVAFLLLGVLLSVLVIARLVAVFS